ncbi:TPA: recombinase RecT [Clostridium botulinum]|uniref:recombinase RecT n=1 Tax=Clostridium botulinum TaxID=1491 RepID=UPI00040D25C0|nr:recombinase RecT [Clostridium botulinum]
MASPNNLNSLLKAKEKALPKGFNEDRFLQNCMTVLKDIKNIEKCNEVSVVRTMLKGVFLGLDFFNKECYAIPVYLNLF